MIRIGAVVAGLKGQEGKPKKRKRTPSEEEAELFKKQDRKDIQDIDIRVNTERTLRLQKLPWTEWAMAAAFLAGAIFIFVYMRMHDVKPLA